MTVVGSGAKPDLGTVIGDLVRMGAPPDTHAHSQLGELGLDSVEVIEWMYALADTWALDLDVLVEFDIEETTTLITLYEVLFGKHD